MRSRWHNGTHTTGAEVGSVLDTVYAIGTLIGKSFAVASGPMQLSLPNVLGILVPILPTPRLVLVLVPSVPPKQLVLLLVHLSPWPVPPLQLRLFVNFYHVGGGLAKRGTLSRQPKGTKPNCDFFFLRVAPGSKLLSKHSPPKRSSTGVQSFRTLF